MRPLLVVMVSNFASFCRASSSDANHSTFKHSSRSRPLKLSMYPFSTGRLDRMKHSSTSWPIARRRPNPRRHRPALERSKSLSESLLHPFRKLSWLAVGPEEMMPITEGDGVIQIPANRFIPAREDVRALELWLCRRQGTCLSGSYDLAEEFVQAGDADFKNCG